MPENLLAIYAVQRDNYTTRTKEETKMTINYNVTGADRKALVKAMGEILEVKPKYLGMPTAAYEVDYFAIDRNGAVTFDDRADSEEVENLIGRLAKMGFTALEGEVEEVPAETEKAAQNADLGLTVQIPLDCVSAGKLTNLLEAKGHLIRKALGVDELPIEISEDAISFPWFSEMPGADAARAYTSFISALCRMSREQARIHPKKSEADNEKYAFRCFLLRLGYIGDEYKADRRILLKNFTGSSAYKNGGAKRAES